MRPLVQRLKVKTRSTSHDIVGSNQMAATLHSYSLEFSNTQVHPSVSVPHFLTSIATYIYVCIYNIMTKPEIKTRFRNCPSATKSKDTVQLCLGNLWRAMKHINTTNLHS